MFQILTQKGWAVVMYEVMFRVNNDHGDWLAMIVAIYFISYHLYATVVNISHIVHGLCLMEFSVWVEFSVRVGIFHFVMTRLFYSSSLDGLVS